MKSFFDIKLKKNERELEKEKMRLQGKIMMVRNPCGDFVG